MTERRWPRRRKAGDGTLVCHRCQLDWALMLSDLHAGNWRRCPRCHGEQDQGEKRLERMEQQRDE